MSAIDRAALRTLHELCGESAPQLVGEFVEQTSTFLGRMSASAELGDWTTVHRLSHTLKGSASTFGARAVGELASSLCEAIRGRADARASSLLAALGEAWRAAESELAEASTSR